MDLDGVSFVFMDFLMVVGLNVRCSDIIFYFYFLWLWALQSCSRLLCDGSPIGDGEAEREACGAPEGPCRCVNGAFRAIGI